MSRTATKDTRLIRILCTILFIVFVFLYLYCYQADLIAYAQYTLSGGKTHYNRLVGALLLTAALWLIHAGTVSLSRLRSYGFGLTYFPSLLLLAALADVYPSHPNLYPSFWLWWIPVLLALYAAIVWLLHRLQPLEPTNDSTGLWSRPMRVSVVSMACLFLMVAFTGNNDEPLHQRLRIECLLASGDCQKALIAGRPPAAADSSLTMLYALTLSMQGQLGDHLFDYPLQGGSAALLPHPPAVSTLMYPVRDIYARLGALPSRPVSTLSYLQLLHQRRLATHPAHDYLLCALLMDKSLDRFAKEIGKYYDINCKTLPKHYREALTLYSHLRSHPTTSSYHDDVMEADFQDYEALMHTSTNKVRRKNALASIYGNTYWYYYQYATP